MTRRRFLQGTTSAGAVLWLPGLRLPPGSAGTGAAPPAGFPAHVELYQQTFENWSREIRVEDLWTCAPRDGGEILEVADWAAAHGYRLRPRGAMHTWTPLHVTGDESPDQRVVLVSTTDHLTDMSLVPGVPAAVRVGPGVRMEDLLWFLESHGLGMTAVPAVGDVTVGGVLAIGGHGAAIPAAGEILPAGKTFGSLSNLVLDMTVVAWDRGSHRHRLLTIDRSRPEAAALLACLGRAMLTEVTLAVGEDVNLRCVSRLDIPAADLFAPPGSSGPTFASFLERTGRAEALWFPFTDKPWLKVWSVAADKPLASRAVDQPYNYPFTHDLPEEVERLAATMVTSNPAAAEVFGPASRQYIVAGLAATDSHDIWGPSKNTMLYIRPSTLRATSNGYAVVTSRENVQRVVHDFHQQYTGMLAAYQARGEYPVNMPAEIRCSGLDHPADVGGGAAIPWLTATRPVAGRPEWDTVVWLNVLTLSDTPGRAAFYTEFERWVLDRFDGGDAQARVEWVKGWAYTAEGPYTSAEVIGAAIPRSLGDDRGRALPRTWRSAIRSLDHLDPNRVFTNSFLDRLLSVSPG